MSFTTRPEIHGVFGVVGSAAPFVEELYASLAPFGGDGGPGGARILATGRRLPMPVGWDEILYFQRVRSPHRLRQLPF